MTDKTTKTVIAYTNLHSQNKSMTNHLTEKIDCDVVNISLFLYM